MKRITGLLLFLAILVLPVAGCARSGHLDPQEPVTITVWHYYSTQLQNVFEELVAEFNNTVGLEKGIVLQAVHQEEIDTLTARIKDSSNRIIGADPLPDLVFAYRNTVYDLDQLQLVADISPYFTEKELAEYVPSYLDEGRITEDGRLLSFPVAKSSDMLYIDAVSYRRFKEAVNNDPAYANISDAQLATFEGIAEIADVYYRWTDAQTLEPHDGKAFFGMDAVQNFVYVASAQLGDEPVTMQDGVPVFSLSPAVAAKLWDYYYGNMLTGRFYSFGRYCSDDMKTGDLIAYIGSTGGARYFPVEIPDHDGNYRRTELMGLKYPVFEQGKKIAIQQGAGLSIIKTDEARQEAAAEFLKWFTAPSQNAYFSMVSGYSPVKRQEFVQQEQSKIHATLSEQDDSIIHNVSAVLALSTEQSQEFVYHIQLAFARSNEVRDMFGNTLISRAKEARVGLENDLASGMPYEQALGKYTGEVYFTSWYQELQTEFEELTR